MHNQMSDMVRMESSQVVHDARSQTLPAASFIAELRSRGFYVKPANNEVLDGIRVVSTLLSGRKIRIHQSCIGLRSEMQSYSWDEKAAERGEEKPVKQQDHGPDALHRTV